MNAYAEIIVARDRVLSAPLDPASFGWSPNRVAFLSAAVAVGWSASQAATKLNLSRNSVIGKARRLGLHFNSDGRSGVSSGRTGGSPAPKATKVAPSHVQQNTRPRAPLLAPDPYVPRPIAVPQEATPTILSELVYGQCKWGLDDPGPGEMDRALFCATPTGGPEPYCEAHRRVAYQPTPARGPKSAKELARSLRRFS